MDVSKFVEYDPVLGWKHKPNSSGEVNNPEYHTTVQYNSTGLRGIDRPYAKPKDVSRILVLGDSFIDGYTVQVQDRLTEVLEVSLAPRFEVINLGVAGYSTDQEVLMLEREGWKYEPELVVLAFFYNDVWGNGSTYLADSYRIKKPLFVTDADGNLKLTNVPVPRPETSFLARFRTVALLRAAVNGNRFLNSLAVKSGMASESPSAPSWATWGPQEFKVYQVAETLEFRRAWTITQDLLRRVKQETENRDIDFVVLYVPSRVELSPEEWEKSAIPGDFDPAKVTRRLAEICKAEGIQYIDPSDRFREANKHTPLYYLHDPHWNSAGNHLAAKILAEHIQSAWPRARQRHSF